MFSPARQHLKLSTADTEAVRKWLPDGCTLPAAQLHLQVVRQLRPAGIARVHGDEDATGGHQAQLTPLEGQAKLMRSCRAYDTGGL